MSVMPKQSKLVQDAIRYVKRCQKTSPTQLQLEIANVLLATNNEHPQSENLQNSRNSLEKVILALLSLRPDLWTNVCSITTINDGRPDLDACRYAVSTAMHPRFANQVLEYLGHPDQSVNYSTISIFVLQATTANPDFHQSAINLINYYQNDATLPTAS